MTNYGVCAVVFVVLLCIFNIVETATSEYSFVSLMITFAFIIFTSWYCGFMFRLRQQSHVTKPKKEKNHVES